MDKRVVKRFDSDIAIECGEFNKSMALEAKMINYSDDGMCFSCRVPFKERSGIIFRMRGIPADFSYPDKAKGPRSISLAEVCWSKKTKDSQNYNYYAIGAKYIKY